MTLFVCFSDKPSGFLVLGAYRVAAIAVSNCKLHLDFKFTKLYNYIIKYNFVTRFFFGLKIHIWKRMCTAKRGAGLMR